MPANLGRLEIAPTEGMGIANVVPGARVQVVLLPVEDLLFFGQVKSSQPLSGTPTS